MYNNRFKDNNEYRTKINEHRPLSEDALKQIKEYYKIGLTYASNAIEGNTLNLAETKVVLEDGITIGGKSLKEHYEAIGHAKAFDKIVELSQNAIFTEEDIKSLHKLFYNQIDEVNAGKYRTSQTFYRLILYRKIELYCSLECKKSLVMITITGLLSY